MRRRLRLVAYSSFDVHPEQAIPVIIRGVVQTMPQPLQQRWTEALDSGHFDVRGRGEDPDDPGTYLFQVFLTDGGEPDFIQFPIYDLAPFIDLPDSRRAVRRARRFVVAFVRAMQSGDLATSFSMTSLGDDGFLHAEQLVFSGASLEAKGQPLWEGDHFEIERQPLRPS
jgi:hypothetical protein